MLFRSTLNQQPAQIEALTGAAVQRAAQRYFDTANYAKVTLMPERR